MAPKIVCVAGPTACGKTTLGVLLAQKFNGEVVSVDSMQIYRGMTVGTAAPTEEEMQGIPHHMIAVADPTEQWSAAEYAARATAAVDSILARGKLPILVGGTGLWMDALIRGHGFAKGHAGGAVRRELEARFEQEGIEPLLAELRQVDPESAARLHPAGDPGVRPVVPGGVPVLPAQLPVRQPGLLRCRQGRCARRPDLPGRRSRRSGQLLSPSAPSFFRFFCPGRPCPPGRLIYLQAGGAPC